MQTVSCLSGQCLGIADVLCSRSRMQMNHQILDSVQAVDILVKEGCIGVSECVERDGLFYSGICHPFLENVCGHICCEKHNASYYQHVVQRWHIATMQFIGTYKSSIIATFRAI